MTVARIAERFWRWLGVATTADLATVMKTENEVDRAAAEAMRAMSKRIEVLEIGQHAITKIIEGRARLPETDAGEPRTARSITPTCASIESESARND